MRKTATGLVLLATVLYPLAVYAALGRVAAHWIAAALVVLALARACSSREGFWWVVAAGAAVLSVVSWWQGDGLALKFYPVLVNAVLLAGFGWSLWFPPSVVERLARLRQPDLPAPAVRYTARVTAVWCVFFVCNGAVAAGTALYGSDEAWALYNGLIAYGAMGLLMAVEWLVRQRVRRRHGYV
ncbi:hypothetical protein ACUTR7_10790 [Delftia sp. NA_296.1]|uniref:hypothetical protein n=1 Tax=Delftia sp. NA_296.1 TaxID=3415648 RepID=UPI004046004E